MSRKKKSSDKQKELQTILLITAILNLLDALVDLIAKLVQ